MNDTIPEISRMQLEIFLSKSDSERFRIGDEFNAFGRTIIEDSVRSENPGISEIDLKIEIFARCYRSYFALDEFRRILCSMREYLESPHDH